MPSTFSFFFLFFFNLVLFSPPPLRRWGSFLHLFLFFFSLFPPPPSNGGMARTSPAPLTAGAGLGRCLPSPLRSRSGVAPEPALREAASGGVRAAGCGVLQPGGSVSSDRSSEALTAVLGVAGRKAGVLCNGLRCPKGMNSSLERRPGLV